MAESKAEKTKAPAAPPMRQLAPASESGDPAVHYRLAELEVARANGDDTAAKAAIDLLAELGFSAS